MPGLQGYKIKRHETGLLRCDLQGQGHLLPFRNKSLTRVSPKVLLQSAEVARWVPQGLIRFYEFWREHTVDGPNPSRTGRKLRNGF